VEQFLRTEMLLGKEAMEKIKNSHVAVFGVGGVGGYVVEALARSGVKKFDLIDNDTVALSNINRQIIATHSSVGKYKVDVMKERILQSSFLDDAEKKHVLKILDSLPQGTSVCHSDLHPANIIITESGEYRVIDWCDTMCDSPLLDVARTLLIYKSVAPMPGTNLEDLNKSRVAWYYFYKSAWENLAGTSENELNKWLAVLAAVKLAESDSTDHQWMKELIRN
jgi:thiamine kinase-like enzyme